MIAIVIATYERPDGRTPVYLRRALRSIKAQTFTDYQVYVVGDKYANRGEFKMMQERFIWAKFINLNHSIERDKYGFKSMKLYYAGGVTAALTGIEMAINDGFEYICHLDHDDHWEPNHLEVINNIIEDKKPLFICTISTYLNGNKYLPAIPITNKVMNFLPKPCGLVCSSVCIRYAETKLRTRDVYAEIGEEYPADADLWRRLRKEMLKEKKKGYVFSGVTCHHDEEGYSLRATRSERNKYRSMYR